MTEHKLIECMNLPTSEAGWAFFLDVDGTLLELAEHPTAVRIDARLPALLAALPATAGSPVALISGRTIAELDRLFSPLRLPCAGQHGAERRDATGELRGLQQGADLQNARRLLAEFVNGRPALYLEDKGLTLCVHFRKDPALGGEVEAVVHELLRHMHDSYEVQPGKMVFELRPRHCDKGRAIDEFMQEAPFAGRRPVFIGDDLTDEHGFEVVNRLDGHTIKVGPGATVARWRIANVDAVLGWLTGYLQACGERCG